MLSRAARPKSCVCVFVPASLSDRVNPLRGLAHLLPALPLFPLLQAFIGLCCTLSQLIRSPTCQSEPLASLRANRTGGNPPLTSQDQTAIRDQWLGVFSRTACYQLPWCFAAGQCLSRGPQGGKTRRDGPSWLGVKPIVWSEGGGSSAATKILDVACKFKIHINKINH